MRAEKLPQAGSEHRVGLRYRHAGPDQAGRGAIRWLEHRVDLGLPGGAVFLHVNAEGQEAAGGRATYRRLGAAGHRQQQRA